MINKNFLFALASLVGTIIGAGVFGIPFVFAKSGILSCFFYFLILGAIVLLLHLSFGEIVLRTREKHRLIGYAEKYLGKKAKLLVAFSVIFGTLGALLAYIILGGNFLKIIFPSPFSSFHLSLILWTILSSFVFWGIKSIGPVELFMNIGFFAAIFLVFFFSFPQIDSSNFTLVNPKYIFLPFGILLFSLIGWNAVPEVETILKDKKNLKKVIVSSVIISTVFYFLFGLIISGVTGGNTSQEAFQGLASFLGKKTLLLGAIFGILTISTSFLVLANYLKNTFIYDFDLPYLLAFFLACFSPLILFLAGLREFIWIIAVVGTLVGLIEGTAIALIFKKAKKTGERTPEYSLKISSVLLCLTVAILIFGGIAQIIYHFSI